MTRRKKPTIVGAAGYFVVCLCALIGLTNGMQICYTHPAIHSQLLDTNWRGYFYPSSHISLQSWAMTIPGFVDGDDDHDNVDMLMRNGEQYEWDQ